MINISADNYEAEIKIIPLEGIFIEFNFQSDEEKLSLKNAIQHYGRLNVRRKIRGAGKSSKKYTNTYLKIIRFDPDENTALIKPVDLPESFQIRIEPNTSMIQKKIRAIQSFFERPKKYYFPILKLFEKYKSQTIEEDRLSIKTTIPKEEFKYLNDERYPSVEEQREFVNIALSTPDFAILEGPPGSGKTTTILEILHQATKLNQRVIMVASTHVAVNNVLERIDEEREKGEELHIFPIRLGDESDVRGVARNYLLDYVSNKETERIIKALKKKGKNLNSIQRNLLVTLENDKKSFDSFILDMANVVCGTTIGILRYPAFDSWEFQISEPFDMLIIDEASKTTLQEFLVPALLAKKWIIIGDKMQLSPFIEEGEIKTLTNRCYIEKNFELNHQWICSEYFSTLDSNLVITDVISLKREILEHIEFSKQEGIVVIEP
ncbi:MAG: AAA domain-containing protein, partial [Candidatus Hermodarchaeota archaeon]